MTIRTTNLKLTIELVPSSSWQNNLRNLLEPTMWNNLKKEVYKRYGYKCLICGSTLKPLHAHEVWEYDDVNHVQKLRNIIALCKNCHGIKHLGHSGLLASKGVLNYEKLVRHFLKVNNCSREEFVNHQKKAFKLFEERSKYEWQLDFSDYKNELSR